VRVDRLVAGQGPWVVVQITAKPRSSEAASGRRPWRAFPVGKRKADVDRRILAVFVLDLGFGERRAAVESTS